MHLLTRVFAGAGSFYANWRGVTTGIPQLRGGVLITYILGIFYLCIPHLCGANHDAAPLRGISSFAFYCEKKRKY